MVTPSGGFGFGFPPPLFGDPRECTGDVAFPPSFGPQPSGAIEETGTISESMLCCVAPQVGVMAVPETHTLRY